MSHLPNSMASALAIDPPGNTDTLTPGLSFWMASAIAAPKGYQAPPIGPVIILRSAFWAKLAPIGKNKIVKAIPAIIIPHLRFIPFSFDCFFRFFDWETLENLNGKVKEERFQGLVVKSSSRASGETPGGCHPGR